MPEVIPQPLPLRRDTVLGRRQQGCVLKMPPVCLWVRDAWLADVPALRGRAGYSWDMSARWERFLRRTKQGSGVPRMGWLGICTMHPAGKCVPFGRRGRPFRSPIQNTVLSSPQVVSFFCHVKKRSLLNASIPSKIFVAQGFSSNRSVHFFYHKKANEHIVLYFINGPVPASRFLRSFREKNRKR